MDHTPGRSLRVGDRKNGYRKITIVQELTFISGKEK